MYRVQGQIPSNWHILSITRVTKSYLLALRTTQISSYFTKHSIKFLTHQAGNNPVTCFVPKPSHILLGYGNFNIFAACSTTYAQLTKTFLTKKTPHPHATNTNPSYTHTRRTNDRPHVVVGCCCCLHIKPFFLPNDIGSTPSVRPDSSS